MGPVTGLSGIKHTNFSSADFHESNDLSSLKGLEWTGSELNSLVPIKWNYCRLVTFSYLPYSFTLNKVPNFWEEFQFRLQFGVNPIIIL